MARIKGQLIRKLLNQLNDAFCEFEASVEAEKSGGKDRVLDLAGPESDVRTPESEGAMDTRLRRGKSMSESFPGFDRIKKQY